MLIIFSVLTFLAFFIMGLYEKRYKSDKLITIITKWLKILILIPFILILLLKLFILTKPLFLDENNKYFDLINKRLLFTDSYQIIDFKNDLNSVQNYYFFIQKDNNSWEITKPLTKFDLTYKSEFNLNDNYKLYFPADKIIYKKIYILDSKSKENNSIALAFDIPQNKFVLYSSDFKNLKMIKDINHYSNTKNLIFLIIGIYIFIYILIKNIPPNSLGRILMTLFILILLAGTGILTYSEIMYFIEFRI